MGTQNILGDLRKMLNEDLQKYSDNICKNFAQEVTEILTEEARTSIDLFYSYQPRYYYRHGNFIKSFKRAYKNRSPRYFGGVELLIDDLPDVYRGGNSDPSSVFWRVYSGYHGIASFQGTAPIMSPAPINKILNKRDEIIANQDKYINKADKLAQQDKYNLFFQ